MLQKGWIEPSTSEYSSPVLIIPKPPPSTKYRFVVDLRAVNKAAMADTMTMSASYALYVVRTHGVLLVVVACTSVSFVFLF